MIKLTIDHKKFNSMIVALFLNCQSVSIILSVTPFNLGLKHIFVFCFLCFLASVTFTKYETITMSRKVFFLPTLILFYYLCTTMLFPGKTALDWIQLFIYVFTPFFLQHLDIEFEQIVRYTLIITSPAIIFNAQIFAHTYYNGITMGLSYAFIPSVICAVIYVSSLYRKGESNKIYLILCAFNLYYFYQILFFGSRGPSISVLSFIALIVLLKKDKDGNLASRYSNISFVVVLIAFILVVFADNIIEYIYNFLNSRGLYIKFIMKNYELSDAADVLNGRDYIYEIAIEGIRQNLLIGHGIAMFESNTGINYPHNFILQLLYDGGLILCSCVLIPVIIVSVQIIRAKRYSDFINWLFLFSISIPGVMFSGDIWEKYTLWYFVAYCLTESKKMKKSYISRDMLEKG